MYDTAETGGAPAPDPRAGHDEWSRYAVSQGMPPEQAQGLTRDQLRVRFLSSGAPLTGIPELERLDEDADAIAARYEARRRPWEAR